VTLRSPPPLDRPLEVAVENGFATMTDAATLVAEGRAIDSLDLEPPVRPSPEEAADAQTRHPFIGVAHPFSRCYVCGRDHEDGLGMHFGPLAAAPEVNGAVLHAERTPPTDDGTVAPEILWAALDCPSYTPDMYDGVAMLGRLAAEVLRAVDRGETLVAVGWPVAVDGRKHTTASALIDADGATVARARALWIGLRDGGLG
jgi:hypothetical protein